MTTFYRRLPRFEYAQPASIGEALSLLAGDKAKVLAGGTDLIPQLKGREIESPRMVVDLKRIPGLDAISYDPVKGLTLGALATITSVERSPLVQEHYPMLAGALITLASPQVRNRATITGNICSAVPSADSAPTLLAMEAELKAVSAKGERLIPITQFFTAPRQTVLARDEIITEIRIPAPPSASKGVYLKLSPRKSMDLAVVGVAAFIVKEGDTCKDVRIALGAVAPTPMREPRAEAALRGKKLTDQTIEEAAGAASSECRPIDDHRGAREYRCDMVYVLTRRALTQIKEEAL